MHYSVRHEPKVDSKYPYTVRDDNLNDTLVEVHATEHEAMKHAHALQDQEDIEMKARRRDAEDCGAA